MDDFRVYQHLIDHFRVVTDSIRTSQAMVLGFIREEVLSRFFPH
jgi:hypothetical protein